MHATRATVLALLAACVVLAFAPGLAGPFVLDDHVNLAPVWAWIGGASDLPTALFDNRSGPLGRPLSYLTLLLNARLGGAEPLGFKLLNLALHLGCAGLVLALVARVLALARGTATGNRQTPSTTAIGAAVALTLAWAVHPMQASTVLYVVQRMAILGAIAQLGAVLLYLEARSSAERDPSRAYRLLFLALPLVVLAGALCKETALLAPLLCAVAEYTLFPSRPRPRLFVRFFLVVLLLPLLLGLVAIAMRPGWILDGYAGREFTLAQRLLTEPRVLMDYIAQWFWPADLALYRDGLPPSDGLLSTWTTLPSLLGCIALFVLALLARRRRPLLAFGLLWFLALHSLEAGPFALEFSFEHRNYLASLGLLLAAWSLSGPWLSRLAPPRPVAAAVVVIALLAGLCAWRSWHWGDVDRLLASEGRSTETSRRLQVDRAIRAFEAGDVARRDAALAVLDASTPGNRSAATLWRAIFACDGNGELPAPLLAKLQSGPPPVVTHNHVSWTWILVRRAASGRCTHLGPAQVEGWLDAWSEAATLPPHARTQFAIMRESLGLAPRASH